VSTLHHRGPSVKAFGPKVHLLASRRIWLIAVMWIRWLTPWLARLGQPVPVVLAMLW